MSSAPPEITVRAVFLAILLAIILAAANAHLGLKVGLTVSASIPAAILSMGILRLFKDSSILENNIVQTGASAGEALVSGVIFILPALLILHYWQYFDYWHTTAIALTGGILGVLFSIPLRRILLADPSLHFPEGTVIGQVLRISQDAEIGSLKGLIQGGALGACVTLFQDGLKIIATHAPLWFRAGEKFVYGFTPGFEPALLAAGYIIGVNVALSTLLGVVLGWVIGIPIFSYLLPSSPALDANSVATAIWQYDVRPIGVGTMLLGGFWTITRLLKPIIRGVYTSFASLKATRASGYAALPRQERDLPIHYTFALLVILLIPISAILFGVISQPALGLGHNLQMITLIIGVGFVLVASFFSSSLCGYFAGLVGSSQNPLSGVSLSALLLASLLLLGLFHWQTGLIQDTRHLLAGEGLAIIIGTLVSSSCAITNDTIQDLKAGQIVGATPWKQQLILILGVLVSALILAPILNLLFNAYGISGISPPGHHMNPTEMLSAPQATLMANLVVGAFTHSLPWTLLNVGFLLAILCIMTDHWLQSHGLRLPVLAVGMGIYLPLQTSAALILGGLISYFTEKTLSKSHPGPTDQPINLAAKQRGLTLACGLVSGACLMGVMLAIPFTIAQYTDVFRVMPARLSGIANLLGMFSTVAILAWIYRTVCRK